MVAATSHEAKVIGLLMCFRVLKEFVFSIGAFFFISALVYVWEEWFYLQWTADHVEEIQSITMDGNFHFFHMSCKANQGAHWLAKDRGNQDGLFVLFLF